ncbi:MAG: hypothetical protein KGJ60_00075 [Verrucomicrobiota bacterium]|nr:hypothetical protein [Verrucomicrobiota bacterium]
MKMKTKFLPWGMAALLGAGGLWVGRAAWRAHRQLVTLDAREMPLAQVLRKIERQTWKKIRAEESLAEVRISLHVTDKPLPYVMDRLAAQAGAHWSTLYAVYDSARALQALDADLRGDGKLAPAGWTQIAPKLPGTEPAGLPQGQPMMVTRTRNGPDGLVIFQEGANGHVDVWSPQELAMESSLIARLGDEHDQRATAAGAAEAARKVGGRWTTRLWFQKSSLGIMAAGIGFRQPGSGQTNLGPTNLGPASSPAYNPNNRFANLTPEQRVQLARQKAQAGGHFEFKRQQR